MIILCIRKKKVFFNMFHMYCFCVKCTWWFFLVIIYLRRYVFYLQQIFCVFTVPYQIYLNLLVAVLVFYIGTIFTYIILRFYGYCTMWLIFEPAVRNIFYFDTVYILHDLRTWWKNRCFILHKFMDVGYFEFDSLVFSKPRLCAFQNFKCKF